MTLILSAFIGNICVIRVPYVFELYSCLNIVNGLLMASLFSAIITIFVFAKIKKTMLRKGLIGLMLVLPAALCFGQTTAPANNGAAQPNTDPNAPVMSFETTSHDFGTMEQDGNGTYLFMFTNTGKEPLVIKEAHGSCGCTVPRWPHAPVNPGQKDTIKVTYDTHRVGMFTKTVTITSNGKESPLWI